MQELASKIRAGIDALVEDIGRRLQETAGGGEIPDVARPALQSVADYLDSGDEAAFEQAIARLRDVLTAREVTFDVLFHIAGALEAAVFPLADSAEEARVLWRACARLRDAISFYAIGVLRTLEQEQAAAVDESAQLFRSVVEHAHTGILIVGGDFRFVYANDELCAMLGYSLDELVGMDFRDVLDDESKQIVADRYVRRQRGEDVSPRYEFNVVRKDGQKRRVEISTSLVTDAAGHVRTVGQILDVTERRRLERELQASLERRGEQVRTGTQVAQEIATAADLDELFHRVVTLIKERFGYYHAQIFRYDSETDAMKLVVGYGEVGQKMLAEGHSLARDRGVVGKATTTATPVLASDVTQDPRWVPNPNLPETKGELAVPIKLRERVLGILDVQSDVAGALSEEDLLLLEGLCGQIAIAIESTQLLEEANIFRQLARSIDQGLAIANLQGNLTYVNPALLEMMGYEQPKGMLGRSVAEFYPESARPQLEEALLAALEFGSWVGELVLISATGQSIPTLQNIFVVNDEDNVPRYIANAITDITARKRSEAQMQAALEELESLYRSISREGWTDVRERARARGYTFDQIALRPADDLWTEAIGRAAERGTLVPPVPGQPAAVAPLAVRGEVFGVLGVEGSAEMPLSEEELTLLAAASEQIAQALESARLFEQTQNALREAELLYQFSEIVSRGVDIQAIYATVGNALVEELGYETSWIAILDEEANVLRGVAGSGANVSDDMIYGSVPIVPGSKNPATLAVLTRAPVVINDPVNDPRVAGLSSKKIGAHLGKIIEVPLLVGDELKGVIAATRPRGSADIGERELRLMQAIATQTSIAIQRAQLFDQMQAALDQTDALYSANWALITAREPEEMLWAVAEPALQTGADTAFLLRFEANVAGQPEWLDVVASIQLAERTTSPFLPQRQSMRSLPLGALLTSSPDQPLMVPDVDALAASLDGDTLWHLKSAGTQALAVIPLRSGNRWLGLVTLHWPRLHTFSAQEEQLFAAIGPQLVTILENRRLLEQAQYRSLQLQAASDISRAASSILSLDELLPQSAELIRDRFDYYYVGIFLTDDSKRYAALRAGTGDAGQKMIALGHKLRVDNASMIGGCIVNRQPRSNQNVRGSDAWYENPLLPLTASELALPLISRGDVVGAMSIQSTELAAFGEEDISVLQTIADQLATAIVNARLFEEVQGSLREVETVQRKYLREAWMDYIQKAAWPRAIAYEYDRVSVSPLPPGDLPDAHRALAGRRPVAVTGTDGDANGRSTLVAPIVLGGEAIGTFSFEDPDTPRAWTADQIALVETVSNQVAMILNSARLFEETQAEAGRRALINAVMQAAVQSTDPLTLLHQAGEAVSARMAVPSALFIWQAEMGCFVPAAFHDAQGQDFLFPRDMLITQEMDPLLFTAGYDQITHVLESPDVLTGALRDAITQLEVVSAIYVPLVSLDQTLGAFAVYQRAGQPALGAEDVAFAETIAGNLSVALQSALLYQEAVETAERLKEVDRLKSQFLANMSHELRTPLNSIIGFSRVILKGIDGPLTDLQRQDLEAIYNSGQHLLGLINDILDISKIDAGKMELAFEEINLNEIVKGVMSTAIGLVKDKDIALRHHVPESTPTIIGDARRIRQVLINLIGNAAKFTDEGFIKISVTSDSKYVTIGVSDSGIGIPLEKQEEIFEAFTQVDASATRKYGGTGLGLTVTRSLVQLHGGRIWVESELGVGSTFYFTLPIGGPDSVAPEKQEEEHPVEAEEERKAEEAPIPTEEAPEAHEEDSTGSRLVLCVDDNEGVLALFERYLKKQGYKVVGLSDSTRVLEEAERLQPYAITLDVMMPEIDGWKLIQDLKANPKTHHIPVVMCTIVSEKGRGMSLGAADYLVKPILEQDLLDALERLDREEGHHRVLVVDDLPDDRSLMRRMVESLSGYEVFEATNGHEAIKLVHDVAPHIIILDLMMPEMDGFTVLETLKANAATRKIPIIVVTAKEITEDERVLLNSHIEAFIQKGTLEREELLSDVTAALDKVGRRRATETDVTEDGG
ncbi:MAG: GAF domain-containing protein [Anaerolineae bacterium]|nr:GAF domain-containing protein [Anaerolineae bacterium]